MRRQAAIILGLCVASGIVIADSDKGIISCLPLDRHDCGCSLAIKQLKCTDEISQKHLFSELFDGAPLWMVIGGQELQLKSSRAADPSGFTFTHGDSWSENYTGNGILVKIEYWPGKDTCPKEKGDDGCEYFDVDAKISVNRGDLEERFDATGTCGC